MLPSGPRPLTCTGCRHESSNCVVQAIEQSIATGDGCVEVRELDLASLASVQRFAHAINAERRHVDILVCNAGIMAPSQRGETSDGIENQFQVPSPFFLRQLPDPSPSSSPDCVMEIAEKSFNAVSIWF